MSTTRRERTRDIGDRQDQERVNATTFERVNATTFGNGDNTRHSKQNRKFWNCEIEAEMKGKSSQESEQRRTNPGESRFALFSFYRPLIWVKKEWKNVKSNQPTEWEASNLRNEKKYCAVQKVSLNVCVKVYLKLLEKSTKTDTDFFRSDIEVDLVREAKLPC